MIQSDVKIINKLGLHARAAAKLVKLVSGFESSVEIGKDGQMVNAKSIMGVMMLAASHGSSVTLKATGTDEINAMAAITALIKDRFEEGE
jgi:phosphocarrier protein